MSKKKKSKKNKTAGKPEKKNKNTKNIIIIALSLLVVIALVAVGIQMRSTSTQTPDSTVSDVSDESLRRGETRSTLSPTQFSNPFIAETYQIARDIPNVLDSLYCYCFCDRAPTYHVSLLSCYVDTHAAG
jgi:cell division septal protein FtsQ